MSQKSQSFEDFNRDDDVKVGSDRSFGFVFAAFFTIIGLWPLVGGHPMRIWALALAVVFVLVSLIYPRLLKPLNIVWFKFGMLLHKIMNPLIMGLLFFVTLTPIALIMKALGKTPISRHFDPDAPSYWIERTPPGPAPDSMKNQF